MYLKMEKSHLVQIGIENCKINLVEPTLIYVVGVKKRQKKRKLQVHFKLRKLQFFEKYYSL